MMFSPEEREALRAELLARARHDNRISGGAVTGSGSIDALDRWSDVDLAFGVRDRDQLLPTLEDFTQFMRDGPGAIDTVDVRRDPWIYRVFLLPNTLQVDLAMAPATDFGARTPSFRLAFGEARDAPHVPQPDPHAQLDAGPSRRACRARGRAPRPRGSGRRSSAGKGQEAARSNHRR